MSVPARDFGKVADASAMQIFAIIVDLYGRKIADEIARELVSGKPTPIVVWPTF